MSDRRTRRPGAPVETEDDDEDVTTPLPDRLITELSTSHAGFAGCAGGKPRHHIPGRAAQPRAGDLLPVRCLGELPGDRTSHTDLPAQAPGLKESVSAEAIDTRHERWKERPPKNEADLWDALIAFDGTAQASLLAHCASFAANALYEPANRYNQGRVSAHGVRTWLDQANVLARAVWLDMVLAGWRPTVDNYLGRVTKPRVIDAVREAKGEPSTN
jgi:ParB family transcriptional regulator, chromosome partitioning protein